MSQRLRPQNPIPGVVRLGVSKCAKCDGRDIRRADEWNFSIATGCIYFALSLDGNTLLFFGEVFYLTG